MNNDRKVHEFNESMDSAALIVAARVIALRHLGVTCTGRIAFDGYSTRTGWTAALDVSDGVPTNTSVKVACLAGVYALERYDRESGGNLRKCPPLSHEIINADFERPTIENEVTEANHIVDNQWPEIIAEWQIIRANCLLGMYRPAA